MTQPADTTHVDFGRCGRSDSLARQPSISSGMQPCHFRIGNLALCLGAAFSRFSIWVNIRLGRSRQGLISALVRKLHRGLRRGHRVSSRAVVQRHLHESFHNAERADIGNFSGAVIVKDQLMGLALCEQRIDDTPLDGIGALFRP
jgi:hypothetical protein